MFRSGRFWQTVACLLVVGATNAQAQTTAQIRGRITDARTTQPLAEVIVHVVGSTIATRSDANGQWLLPDVQPGTHTLRFRRLGYDTATQAVTVAAGDDAVLDVALHEVAAVVAPVVVSATREQQRRTESSATIDVLDGANLRLARASHPAQVMQRIAGVHASQLSGEGHSMAIRQPITTKPMYLYLEDGIPTRATGFFNHNALYEVNIPQAGGLEVLKGPGTALYGSDAIGGVVNVLTRPAPLTPTMEGSVEGGMYGWQRALVSGGNTFGRHGLRVDANFTRAEGWRSHAPYDRLSGTIRWDMRPTDELHFKTVITATRVNQNDVVAVNEALFHARSNINRSPISYRHVEAIRWSTAVDKTSGLSAWSITPYARYNVLDLLPSWQLSYDPQVWMNRNNSLGVLARYRRDFEPANTRVIGGVDVDYSPGSFVADQAVVTTTGAGTSRVFESYVRGARHYDYDIAFHQVSPYVHLESSPLSQLRFDAGLRFDQVGYDYTTHLAPMDTGAHRRPASQNVQYRRLSPKIGVTYDINSQVNVYSSWRTGFRAPSHSNLFQQNTAENSTALRPVSVESWELGLRGESGGRVAWSLVGYDMDVANDIITYITEVNSREATNAGRTRHQGIEASVGLRVLKTLRLDLSGALASHKYVTWVPQAARGNTPEVRYDGNDMEQAPGALSNALLTWTPSLLRGGRLAAEWSHTGGYRTDAANVGPRYAGHDLLTLHANMHLRSGVEVYARAVNVLDRNHAELVAYDRFQGLQFTPGTPRSIFAGVRFQMER